MRAATLLLLGTTTLARAQVPDAGPGSAPLAIVGARILPSPGVPPIADGVIVIREGRISEVGKVGQIEIPEDARILDARGLTATAGFWNAHVHLVDVFAPRWMGADTIPADSLARRLEESFTHFGYTTVVDLGSPPDNTLAIRRRIESGEVPGPRILTAGVPIFPPGGAPELARAFHAPEPATPAQGVVAVRGALEKGVDLIKVATAYFSAGFSGGGPARMPLEVVRAIVAEAHERNALVVAHPEDLEGVRDAVAAGVDVVAHTTESGGVWPENLVERMVGQWIALVPTLYLYHVGTVFKGGTREEADAYVEGSGVLEQLRSFARAGGEVLFGTDAGFYPETDMTPEIGLMARAGMTWESILASMTTAPAARFGRAEDVGTVAPGMEADLVLLGGDPAEDVGAFADVRFTIRAGELIHGPATESAPPSPPIAIVGGTVFPSPEAPPIEDGVVLVVDGRIAAVGPRSEVEIPADAERIDATGGSVLPGFWNAHVHFTESTFMGADTLPAEGLAEALREMLLRHGFVHVLDTGSYLENTLALRARIESGEVPGPEIWTAGAPFTAPQGTPIYVRPIELPALATPEAARDSVRARLDRGADAIKLFTGSPVDWEKPPVLMNETVVAAVTGSAHAAGALVLAHPTSVSGAKVAALNGVDLILHTTPDDTAPWDDELMSAMIERQVHLAPTLKLWAWEGERTGRPPEAVHAFQQTGVRQLAGFARAGGRVVFGTDVGYMADHDPADEFRLMAEAGLDFEALLAALTTTPARLLGREHETGVLAVGRAGDLVVVDGRPDRAIEALGEVRLTMREGRVVYQRERLGHE